MTIHLQLEFPGQEQQQTKGTIMNELVIDETAELARLRAVAEAKGDPGDAGALRAAITELGTYRRSLATMRASRDQLRDELAQLYNDVS